MKFYSILEGQTQDVLRRLLRLINKNQAGIKALEDAIGDEETADTILYRIKKLEDAKTEPGGEGG